MGTKNCWKFVIVSNAKFINQLTEKLDEYDLTVARMVNQSYSEIYDLKYEVHISRGDGLFTIGRCLLIIDSFKYVFFK